MQWINSKKELKNINLSGIIGQVFFVYNQDYWIPSKRTPNHICTKPLPSTKSFFYFWKERTDGCEL